MSGEFKPWRESVLYQAYPWSFKEDEEREPQLGNGSIKGMTEKVPYMADLGVDAVWVSPPYDGPMKDAGYDISDFTSIHPSLGTLEDFDEFVATCHERDIRVMLDFIPNHSSDQHEWFQKSRRREKGYEDYYIWHAGKRDSQGNLIMGPDGRPIEPNNWGSVFSKPNRKLRDAGGMRWLRPGQNTPPISSWQWDELRGEYYLRTFVKEQPDLNWHNPEVSQKMVDSMRFWIERGVDGFRIDAFNHMAKNYDFPDEPLNPDYSDERYDNPYDSLILQNSSNFMPEYVRTLKLFTNMAREYVDKGRDIQFIVESYMDKELLKQANAIDPEIATVFNFEAFRKPWDARQRDEQLARYYGEIDSRNTPNQVNGNHDNTRLATRLGDVAARAAGVLNLMLPGMRVIYSGEELGLHDGVVPDDRLQDPNGFRDPERMPTIWSSTAKNAGFSRADESKLWLPVNEADLHLSVEDQLEDDTSSLNMYKAFIAAARKYDALRSGDYKHLDVVDLESSDISESALAFARTDNENPAIVAVNMTPHEVYVKIKTKRRLGRIVLSSIDLEQNARNIELERGLVLRPDELVLII